MQTHTYTHTKHTCRQTEVRAQLECGEDIMQSEPVAGPPLHLHWWSGRGMKTWSGSNSRARTINSPRWPLTSSSAFHHWNLQSISLVMRTIVHFAVRPLGSPNCPSRRSLYLSLALNVDHQSQYHSTRETGTGYTGVHFCLKCSHPELTEDHVLTSAYVKIFRTVTRNAANKSV